MSAVNATVDNAKASKKKKKTKKKANGQSQSGATPTVQNGRKDEPEEDNDGEEEEDPRPGSNALKALGSTSADEKSLPLQNGVKGTQSEQDGQDEDDDDNEDDDDGGDDVHALNGADSGANSKSAASSTGDTSSRLDALQQERDSLRAEVTQMRKSLENLQEKHSEELSGIREELKQSEQNKESAEAQYRNLRDKINTIRSQLGERLKADAAELEQARERIEELETTNKTAREENERLQANVSKLSHELDSQQSEIETIRSRTNVSTNNWARERDDMVRREAQVREEYEEAKQAMQDWEILATEERSRREALEDQVQELKEQLGAQQEAFERAQGEAETQSSTVDGLQRALRDIQDERKRELREMVEQTQAQLEALRIQAKAAEDTATELRTELEGTQKELARTAPFEKEVKEKNLLIGKLRHEAVILNDHLTKALRFLKRGKPEDNVDRQIVTNHLLHFLQLDRSDPKKFQVLQLIAALLGWDEQQREQAGLLRQGSGFASAGGSLRVPLSPFRRTPSTPQLSGDFSPVSPGGEAGRESLAELWSDFLERESESGSGTGHSRRPSTARMVRSPSLASQSGIRSPTSEKGSLFSSRPGMDAARKESSGTVSGLGLGRTDSMGSGR